MSTEPTMAGESLIKAWTAALNRVDKATRDLRTAECDLANAVTALGKWMMPYDAVPGEAFAIWYVDALIHVKNLGDGRYEITTRSRGRKAEL